MTVIFGRSFTGSYPGDLLTGRKSEPAKAEAPAGPRMQLQATLQP
jgi:hypothetical protein